MLNERFTRAYFVVEAWKGRARLLSFPETNLQTILTTLVPHLQAAPHAKSPIPPRAPPSQTPPRFSSFQASTSGRSFPGDRLNSLCTSCARGSLVERAAKIAVAFPRTRNDLQM